MRIKSVVSSLVAGWMLFAAVSSAHAEGAAGGSDVGFHGDRPDGRGTVAHLSIFAPSNGWVVATATFQGQIRNNGKLCDFFSQLDTSPHLPNGNLPCLVQQRFPDTINTMDSSTSYSFWAGAITCMLPVTQGTNSIYLNGSSSCGDYLWTHPAITATFTPDNLTQGFSVP
jgi:hypothetical protein